MTVAPAIAATGVAKVYVSNGKAVHAIRDASFDVPEAAFVSLIGPSGCGKSTLLKMIGGLDRPTAGELLYQGKPVDGINHNVGYVPQHDHLLPWRSVASNIAIGLEFRGQFGAGPTHIRRTHDHDRHAVVDQRYLHSLDDLARTVCRK